MSIAAHSKTISINAYNGFCIPKNKNDHNILSNNWIPNKVKAILACFFLKPFSQTKYNEMPIKTYNVIQTGPKIQLGGLKIGFCKVRYQVETELEVNTEPIKAASKGIKIDITNFTKFIFFIFYSETHNP